MGRDSDPAPNVKPVAVAQLSSGDDEPNPNSNPNPNPKPTATGTGNQPENLNSTGVKNHVGKPNIMANANGTTGVKLTRTYIYAPAYPGYYNDFVGYGYGPYGYGHDGFFYDEPLIVVDEDAEDIYEDDEPCCPCSRRKQPIGPGPGNGEGGTIAAGGRRRRRRNRNRNMCILIVLSIFCVIFVIGLITISVVFGGGYYHRHGYRGRRFICHPCYYPCNCGGHYSYYY